MMLGYTTFINDKACNTNVSTLIAQADKDGVKGLSKQELRNLILSIKGTLTPVSDKSIINFSDSIFNQINKNNKKEIGTEDLDKWLKRNYNMSYKDIENSKLETVANRIEEIDNKNKNKTNENDNCDTKKDPSILELIQKFFGDIFEPVTQTSIYKSTVKTGKNMYNKAVTTANNVYNTGIETVKDLRDSFLSMF